MSTYVVYTQMSNSYQLHFYSLNSTNYVVFLRKNNLPEINTVCYCFSVQLFFFFWWINKTWGINSLPCFKVVIVFLAGHRSVFYLLVSVCSITGMFLSGLVWEQAAWWEKHTSGDQPSLPRHQGPVGAGVCLWKASRPSPHALCVYVCCCRTISI